MERQEEPRYEQKLSRSLGVFGNVAITLSAVTPASSVFIIVPLVIVTAGTGSFLAMVFAGIIGIFMAFCWAELSAAYPISSGDYALVWHSFKGKMKPFAGPLGMMTLALVMFTGVLIPAVIALGTASFLSVIWTFDTENVGAIVIAASAALAILNIRLNAVVTTIFLLLELLALVILTVLGLINLHFDRIGSLFSGFEIGNAGGEYFGCIPKL